MAKPLALITAWLPNGVLSRLETEFPDVDFREATGAAATEQLLTQATLTYGLPPVQALPTASSLRWIQLVWAGVPPELCQALRGRDVTVTNLAGLYGPSIAEHALALAGMLARNLQIAVRNQQEQRWDRDPGQTMTDLHGRTLAVIGLGNIGRSIARLGRCYGMRVIGCRRTERPTPEVDRVYALTELPALLAEADYVVVAAPLTRHTEGMLGPREFQATKEGVIYINVSRGGIAQEAALLDALRSGRVRAAGLDVFAVEPLPPGHPLWSLPQVVITPHYSGETVNRSALPAERFARNLHSWLAGRPLEGLVNLEWGY